VATEVDRARNLSDIITTRITRYHTTQ